MTGTKFVNDIWWWITIPLAIITAIALKYDLLLLPEKIWRWILNVD